MRCGDILKNEILVMRGGDPELPDCVTSNTGKLLPGGVFIAIPGTRCDGHDFIPEAEKKAAVIIHSRELDSYLPDRSYLLVKDSSVAASLLIRAKYGKPDKELDLYGVTGTNGKTTTAYILEHLLPECGLLSTVEFRNGRTAVPATHTTPDPETLFRILHEMRENHLVSAAMELSSHALDQNRAYGAGFKAAIFTNLTGDHLDYHKDMEHYYQAKKRFFTGLLLPDGTAVINVDDAYGKRLAEELSGIRKTVTFSFSGNSDWQIKNFISSRSGSVFDLFSGNGSFRISSNLAGKFNACNLTGAILAVMANGMSADRICMALKKKITVPGRLQFADVQSEADFVVDYAHTDDALENIIKTLRPLTEKRLICVFGAGGDRDKSKRPRMGRAAALADELVVTSDNPRNEDPGRIIADIISGIPAGTPYRVITDRREAIRHACASAGKGDIVLIAGKGHENYQEIQGVRNHFSDSEVVGEYFGEKNK